MHVLRDELVTLGEWGPDDAQWYVEQSRDAEIQRFTTEPEDLNEEQVRAAIADLPGLAESVGYLIRERDTGRRAGNIALAHARGVGEISYWVAPGARGRGVATAAVRLLSEWAFGALDLSEIRLWTRVGNVASQRVATRCGYRRSPVHDKVQQVRGRAWDLAAFVLTPEPSPSGWRGDATGRAGDRLEPGSP